MDPSYERPLTGADVIAQAAAAGVGPDALAVIDELLGRGGQISGQADLVQRIGPDRLGMTAGRWDHVFGPLFGEFE